MVETEAAVPELRVETTCWVCGVEVRPGEGHYLDPPLSGWARDVFRKRHGQCPREDPCNPTNT